MKTFMTFATGLTCLALVQPSLAQSKMTAAQELKRALGTNGYAPDQNELKANLNKILNIKNIERKGFSVNGFRAILDLSNKKMTTIRWQDLSGISEDSIEDTVGESKELIDAAKKNQVMEVRKYSHCSVRVTDLPFESLLREQETRPGTDINVITKGMVETRKKYLMDNGIKILTDQDGDNYVAGTGAGAFVSCRLTDVGLQTINEADISLSAKAKQMLSKNVKEEDSSEELFHFLITSTQILQNNPPSEMWPQAKKEELGKLFFNVLQITEEDLEAKSIDDIWGETYGFRINGY